MVHRRNKYIGPRSCYASEEGAYAPGKGLTEETFFTVLALILRDVKRGWSYDDKCNRIPFSKDYALQRVIWGGALAHTHTERDVAGVLMEVGREVLEQERLPEWALVLLAGPRAGELAEELVSLGICRPEQVRVARGEEVLVH